uniref:PGG domain-containing protein n=1 Tax=Leersia perrieri TaxID=77586 RepID=A0A0D9UZ69_9ORYZ
METDAERGETGGNRRQENSEQTCPAATGRTTPAGDGSHAAGDPIMRDKNRRRYWLFMVASWAGFGSSMVLTLGLLTGVPSRSRAVQWPFLVAYSSLVLTFITSQPRTPLTLDILIWVVVMGVLTVGIKYRRLDKLRFWFCQPAL